MSILSEPSCLNPELKYFAPTGYIIKFSKETNNPVTIRKSPDYLHLVRTFFDSKQACLSRPFPRSPPSTPPGKLPPPAPTLVMPSPQPPMIKMGLLASLFSKLATYFESLKVANQSTTILFRRYRAEVTYPQTRMTSPQFAYEQLGTTPKV